MREGSRTGFRPAEPTNSVEQRNESKGGIKLKRNGRA